MKRSDWLLLTMVFAAPFLVYLPTLSGWFLADDYGFAPLYGMSAKDILRCLQMVHEGDLRLYTFRPVALVSLLLDYHMWGWNPFGFHLTNSVLHSCNTLLICFLARTLKMSKTASIISALLFGLYPGHSEAVAWISCRFDLLSQFFFILSLLLWIVGRNQRNTRWMTLSALVFLLSLFTKETVVGGIILFPLIDWLFLREKSNPTRFNRFWLNWIGVQTGILLIFVLTRLWLFGNLSGDIGTTRREQFCTTSFMDCAHRLWQALWMLITPVSRLLFADFAVAVAGAFIILACISSIYVSFMRAKHQDYTPIKLLLFALVWILALIIPTLFVAAVAESLDGSRFLYMPCTGLALIIGISVNYYSLNPAKRFSKWALIPFIMYFLISAGMLWQYNNATWVEAGRVVKEVDQVLLANTQNIQDGDTIVVVNLPWSWKGAHFAPNGYDGYLQWIHQKRHISLIYVERDPAAIDDMWLKGLYQAEFRDYYVFAWNDDTQSLQPLIIH